MQVGTVNLRAIYGAMSNVVRCKKWAVAVIWMCLLASQWFFPCCPQALRAQTETQPLDQIGFVAELQRLSDICARIGLPLQAQQAQSWQPRDGRDYLTLFLPVDEAHAAAESHTQLANFNASFALAKKRFAKHLYEQCVRLAEQGDEGEAYRVLWQVLRNDSTHPEARRILGTLATASSVRPQNRRVLRPLEVVGWPVGSYQVIETPNFVISTRASSRETIALASKLEVFYALWTQAMYPLWADAGALQRRMAGGKALWQRERKLQVVLFKNRLEYLEALGVGESNIEVSVGYYNPTAKSSFFYPDEGLEATLIHELTHQLLAEATNFEAISTAGKTQEYWLVEGIAIYFESMRPYPAAEGCWTLGGNYAKRIQTARYRAVRDGFWI
ncbi:MAG: hypothetical protein KDB03_26335, partial [Planctomycetales bacterium]|nr:hypothetical protein [Planctomycetales bacterium]